MKAYFSIFKMRLIAEMQYRTAAWAGISTQFFFGMIFIMVYTSFYKSSGGIDTMTITQLTSYLWLNQAFLAIIMVWSQDNVLLEKIARGDISYELTKPYDLFKYWFASLSARRLAAVSLRFLPIIIFSLLLPAPYGLSISPSIYNLLLFIISISLSLFLNTAISMYIYILTFKTLSPYASKMLMIILSEFLMGALIPIPLMPDLLQKIVNFFPFRYVSDLPFRIYSGNLSLNSSLIQIVIQIIWIIVLVFVGKKLLNKVLKKVVIQGG